MRSHQNWTDSLMAPTSMLGVIDSYAIELIHPVREGRSEHQIGKKGKSNYRWIVGGKLAVVLDHLGLITAWDCDTANVHGTHFQHLIRAFEDEMVVLADTGFHVIEGDPSNLKVCKRGEWNERMGVETTFSMLTLVCNFKKMRHRVWDYFRARLAFTMAAFNLLVQWGGMELDQTGFVHRSIARFCL